MQPTPVQNFLAQLTSAQPRPPLVSKLGTIGGMDSYSDPTTLPDGYVTYLQNMRLLKDVAYTREGWLKTNPSEMPLSTGIFGLGVYLPLVSYPILMAVSNGKVYIGVKSFVFPFGIVMVFTEVYSGISTSNLCTILQVQDIAMVVDGATGMLVYKFGQTPYFAGINTPQTYNLLSSFEATETWTVTGGTQTPDLGHKVHGEQSINFLSTVGGLITISYTLPSALDLTAFPDGSTSGGADYIRIYFLRGDPATFSSCVLDLITSGGNYFTVSVAALTTWTDETRSYVGLDLMIPKSAFSTVGSPSWTSITSIIIAAQAAGGTQASMTLDFLTHFKCTPTIADSGVLGNLSGPYTYKMTFLTANDDESEASLPSNTVTVTAKKMTITNLPLAGSSRIIRRRLYRVGGVLTDWRLVYQFEDNIQTTFTDNTKDSDLGEVFVDVSGIPYIPSCIAVHGDYVVIANLTTQDGLYYPDGIMVSQELSYEIFDHLKFFTLEKNSGTRVMWLHSEFGLMYVGKEDAIWSFDPTNLDIKPRVETRLYGGVGVKAVTRGENCFYFLDPLAVVRCDGSSFAEISNPFVRNYLEAIPKEWFYRVWMEYYDHTLYIGVPQKIDKEDIIDVGGDQVIDASTNDVIINNAVATNIILVYDVPKQRWYVLTGWDVLSATTSFSPAFGRHLYLGSTSSGYVYDAFVGDDDDGTPIESIIRTKDDCFGEPETLKDYEKFFVTGEKLTVDDVQLTLTLYRDRVAAGVVIADSTTLLDSFIHNKLEIPAPDMGGPGTYLGVEIKATKRWLFRSLTQVVRPREATY